MTRERRYDDQEVRQIFEAAAGPSGTLASGPSSDGLTLTELQEIGAEVGLSPERISQVALSLDASAARPRRKQLGLPVSVGRTVDLPRAPTDLEWDLLVAALRETFGARGKVSESGSIREWTNGNLHAYVEPTSEGHRLRLGTLSGRGVALNRMAVISGVLTAVMLVLVVLADQGAGSEPGILMFAAIALTAMLSNVISLPRWARERDEQMGEIADRALAILAAAPPHTVPHE